MPSSAASLSSPELVVVHPLVLLSVVDHYKRAGLGPGKRVVGVLLGHWTVPFEENEKDPTVWYLDHNYHENMCELYKKINAKERPVGWYHSGPKLRASDLKINELIQKYCMTPVLCIVDPIGQGGTLPVQSYVVLEEIQEGRPVSRTFAHVNSALAAEEAEEVGVEHLLRDIKDGTAGNLTQTIATKTKSLMELEKQLMELDTYLGKVVTGQLPVQQKIISAAQDMFNLLPDVHSATAQLALTVKTNDQLAMIYVGALARAIVSLNDLVTNKLDTLQQQTP